MKTKKQPYRKPSVEQFQQLMRAQMEATAMKPLVKAVKTAVRQWEAELRAGK
jgi:hypothetical protein